MGQQVHHFVHHLTLLSLLFTLSFLPILPLSSAQASPSECTQTWSAHVTGSKPGSYTMKNNGYVWLDRGDDNYQILLTKPGVAQKKIIADCDNVVATCCGGGKDDRLQVCTRDCTFLAERFCADSKSIYLGYQIDLRRGDKIDANAGGDKGSPNLDIQVYECPVDADHDGHQAISDAGDDCNDADPTIHPQALEICDDKDNNCDGEVDEGLGQASFQDVDRDGFGNPDASSDDCSQPEGYIPDNTDCDDHNPLVNPTQTEICGDGIDNDCNDAQNELDICAETNPSLCEQKGGIWVGTPADGDCCGNYPAEYFNARVGLFDPGTINFPTGCWDSTTIDDDHTVATSFIREDDENTWTVGQNTFFDQRPASAGRQNIVVLGIEGTASHGYARQYISQLHPNSEYMFSADIRTRRSATATITLIQLGSDDPTNVIGTPLVIFSVPPNSDVWETHLMEFTTGPGEYFGIEVAVDIPNADLSAGGMFDELLLYHKPSAQVLNSLGTYYGCKVTDSATLNVDDTNREGTQRIVDASVDYCATQGSWFCSYVDTWIEGEERNTPSTSPPGAEGESEDGFLPQECCSGQSCWDGYHCVPSIDLQTNPLIDPTMVGSHAYVCVNGLSGQSSPHPIWVEADRKPNPDETEFGYCNPGQCFFSAAGEDPQCVADGFWNRDNYCDGGEWTTRTQMVALTLMDMAGENDYTLFCDNGLQTTNRLEYSDGFFGGREAWTYLFGDALPRFGTIFICDDLPEGTPCANNLCVLRWNDLGEDKVAFGVALNEPLDKSFDYSLLNVFEESRYSSSTNHYDHCDAAKIRSAAEHRFIGCTGKTSSASGTSASIWYHDPLQALIYGEQETIVGNPNIGQLFIQFLQHPFGKIVNFITHLFSSRGQEDYAFIENKVKDFNSLYLSTFDTRQMRGVQEQIGADLFTTINFYDYQVNVCQAVEEYCEENSGSSINGCFGKAVSCQPTIIDGRVVFNVEAKNLLRGSHLWSGLTAAIRTKEAMVPQGSVTFTPSIAASRGGIPVSGQLQIKDQFTVTLQNYNPSLEESLIGYFWEFGDGTATSTINGQESLTHRYVHSGSYTLTLSILDKYFRLHDSNAIPITVTSPCDPGDVNADGAVNCIDLQCVSKQMLGLPVDAGCNYINLCGDVAPLESNGVPAGDGMINIGDVTTINSLITGDCPFCSNEERDFIETGVDCGDVCGIACPTCTDGIQNQAETDTDCGGQTTCRRCAGGEDCELNSDCALGYACRIGQCTL